MLLYLYKFTKGILSRRFAAAALCVAKGCKTPMSNENCGHRDRMRERLLKDGLDGFQDHEVLEMLLYHTIPRKDTNKLAHKLLHKFGSFANVMNASPQQLMTVDGISEVTACYISVVKETWRRYVLSAKEVSKIQGVSQALEYAKSLLAFSGTERAIVVYLNFSSNAILVEEFNSGQIDRVNVEVKNIVATAMRTNAAAVVLCHTHINGLPDPSQADDVFTNQLCLALCGVDVVLAEHAIFTDDGNVYSYRESGKLAQIQNEYQRILTVKQR